MRLEREREKKRRGRGVGRGGCEEVGGCVIRARDCEGDVGMLG